MASVFHFPTSHKLFSLSLLPSLSTHHNHHFFIICSSKSAISASIKKTRARRKVKSNDDLCNDIREFLSSVGLPDDHVPTMKELSQHGRKDLANIVRRRGYKLVKELLLTSKQPNYECRGEDVIVEKSEDELLDGKKTDTTHDVSLPSEASAVDDDTNYANNGIILNSDEQNSGDQEPLDYSSLEEKVANFIENGELESVEDDDDLDIFQRGEQVERSVEGKNVVATDSTTAELLSGNSIAQSTQHVEHPSRPSSPMRKDKLSTENLTVNEGRIRLDTEPDNMEIEAEINHLKLILHQKELELTQLKQQIEKEMRLLSMMEIEAETKIREAHRILSEKDAELNAAEDSLSGLKEVEIEYRADADSVEVAGSFNGWHQKIKMDLEESSDPIGEDKQASSDSIDPIGEDIQASSDSIDPIGIRNPRLWKTVLWLYPGIYEIKFVVDGHHWTTDPQRETLTRGSIHNNVLRVDR